MQERKPEIIKYMLWGIISMAAILAFAFIVYIMHWAITYPGTSDLIATHIAAVLGLPISAIAAFLLVFLLKAGGAPIEIEALSFKFKGAAGPTILWIFCFLAMVTGIKILF